MGAQPSRQITISEGDIALLRVRVRLIMPDLVIVRACLVPRTLGFTQLGAALGAIAGLGVDTDARWVPDVTWR